MIQYPSMSAPVQQQNQPLACAMPAPEFNAIKINIQGAQVTAPNQQPVYPVAPETTPVTVPPPAEAGAKVDYQA